MFQWLLRASFTMRMRSVGERARVRCCFTAAWWKRWLASVFLLRGPTLLTAGKGGRVLRQFSASLADANIRAFERRVADPRSACDCWRSPCARPVPRPNARSRTGRSATNPISRPSSVLPTLCLKVRPITFPEHCGVLSTGCGKHGDTHARTLTSLKECDGGGKVRRFDCASSAPYALTTRELDRDYSSPK